MVFLLESGEKNQTGPIVRFPQLISQSLICAVEVKYVSVKHAGKRSENWVRTAVFLVDKAVTLKSTSTNRKPGIANHTSFLALILFYLPHVEKHSYIMTVSWFHHLRKHICQISQNQHHKTAVSAYSHTLFSSFAKNTWRNIWHHAYPSHRLDQFHGLTSPKTHAQIQQSLFIIGYQYIWQGIS